MKLNKDSKQKNYLVFDIGGTYTRVAFFKGKKLVKKEKNKTIKNKKILDFLENKIEKFKIKYNIGTKFDGISIAFPGNVDSEKLLLVSFPNLPKIKNLELGKLKKHCKKLVLENDANCATIGAYEFLKSFKNSKSRSVKNLVCLTLGTGVGCGLMINGKLYKGKGKASEFGHSTIDINGKPCSCGNKGCLENYVSSRGLIFIAKKQGLKKIDCYKLQELAKNKNNKALKVYEEYGKLLSFGIVNIANTLDPDIIVLTGGLCNSSKYFISKTRKESKKRFFSGINPRIKVVKKNLSLIGALDLLE